MLALAGKKKNERPGKANRRGLANSSPECVFPFRLKCRCFSLSPKNKNDQSQNIAIFQKRAGLSEMKSARRSNAVSSARLLRVAEFEKLFFCATAGQHPSPFGHPSAKLGICQCVTLFCVCGGGVFAFLHAGPVRLSAQ